MKTLATLALTAVLGLTCASGFAATPASAPVTQTVAKSASAPAAKAHHARKHHAAKTSSAPVAQQAQARHHHHHRHPHHGTHRG